MQLWVIGSLQVGPHLQLGTSHSIGLVLLRSSVHLSMQRASQALRRLQPFSQPRHLISGGSWPALEV